MFAEMFATIDSLNLQNSKCLVSSKSIDLMIHWDRNIDSDSIAFLNTVKKSITCDGNHNQTKEQFKIELTTDKDIFSEIEQFFLSDSCHESYNSEIMAMPMSKGVAIKEYLSYLIVNWEGAGYVVAKMGSSCMWIINNINIQQTMLKYFVLAPLVCFEELFPVHGSTICYNKSIYLLLADSNKGKTSFTLAFWTRHGSLISEDISYFLPDGRVLDVCARDYITLRMGTLAYFKDYLRDIYEKFNLQKKSKEDLFTLGKEDSVRISVKKFISKSRYDYDGGLVDCILVPNISPENSVTNVTDVSEKDIQCLLKRSCRQNMYRWIGLIMKNRLDINCDYSPIENIFLKARVHMVSTGLDYLDEFDLIIRNCQESG